MCQTRGGAGFVRWTKAPKPFPLPESTAVIPHSRSVADDQRSQLHHKRRNDTEQCPRTLEARRSEMMSWIMKVFWLVLPFFPWANSEINPAQFLYSDHRDPKLVNSQFFPTEEEFERSILIPPTLLWQRRIQRESGIRWLTLGGSNTYNPDNYVPILTDALAKIAGNVSTKVYNAGISGSPPMIQRYAFESLPPSNWPNIVSFEYGVNCHDNIHACLKPLNRVLQYLRVKWKSVGLPPPLFLILEFSFSGPFYSNWAEGSGSFDPMHLESKHPLVPAQNGSLVKFVCSHEENSFFNSSLVESMFNMPSIVEAQESESRRNGFFHGNYRGIALSTFARFYRIPYLSFSDALWPSLVRYAGTHAPCSVWPFTKDGVHWTELGAKLIVHEIIIPFVQLYILPRDHVNHSDSFRVFQQRQYLHTKKASDYREPLSLIQLYPPENENAFKITLEGRLWGISNPSHYSMNEFLLRTSASVSNTPVNSFAKIHTTYHENDPAHVCYGSNKPTVIMTHDTRNNVLSNAEMASSDFAYWKFSIPQRYMEAMDLDVGMISKLTGGNKTSAEMIAINKDHPGLDTSIVSRMPMFRLEIDYLRSWNVSYVGDARCKLYECNHISQPFATNELFGNAQKETSCIQPNHLIADVILKGNEQPTPYQHAHTSNNINYNVVNSITRKMTFTGPLSEVITDKMSLWPHILQCQKLDARLACFAAITVYEQ